METGFDAGFKLFQSRAQGYGCEGLRSGVWAVEFRFWGLGKP